jgi:molybdenum cofactor biosynthesis protein MoaF
MTSNTSESTNWISVGALAQSFAPESNTLARSEDLAGKSFVIDLADGHAISYQFATDSHLNWTATGPGGVNEGSETYLATCLRDGIYFVDFVKAEARPPVSVSIVLDFNLGVATSVTATLPASDDAHGSVLRRAQLQGELTSVSAEIVSATIDHPYDAALPHHQPTTDLIGLRLQHRYNPHEVYEHIYLNEKFYAWHCLSGIELGLADVDRCHYYKIARDLYLFVWREKIVPTLGAILVDLEQMKTTGKIFGYADDTLSSVSNFQVGARSKVVNRTTHVL